MPGGPFVIFAGEETWRVTAPGAADELRFDRDAPAKSIAAAVAAKLRGRGYQGEGVLLALPSAWCLAAQVSLADLPRHDRAAMAFRLEEKLPLAAESFTADFVTAGDRALGVCVANDKVRPLVEALEYAGVVVQSVAPAALLALQSRAPADSVVLWGEDDRVNVFVVEDRKPVTWTLAATPDELRVASQWVELELGTDATPLALDVPDDWLAGLGPVSDPVAAAAAEVDLYESATRAAAAVLAGRAEPWVEFRRGAMAIDDRLRVVRRPINAALAAAAVFFAVLAVVFLYRSSRYDALAQSFEIDVANDFKTAFPGWPVPPNVKATVESERRKLMLAGSSALPVEAQESALRVLHDVLARVPPDAKLNFEKMTFNDTSLELEGLAKSYEDVDVLVAAAKSAGMADVPPPKMTKTAAGAWHFTVIGSKPIRTRVAAGAGGRE